MFKRKWKDFPSWDKGRLHRWDDVVENLKDWERRDGGGMVEEPSVFEDIQHLHGLDGIIHGLGSDSKLYRLNTAGNAWEEVECFEEVECLDDQELCTELENYTCRSGG